MKARISGVKKMILPAIGVGLGTFASPRVSDKLGETWPTLAKYPELSPLILLIVAILLLRVPKARTFSIGLGAVALYFLSVAIYNRITKKAAVAAPPTNGKPTITPTAPGYVYESGIPYDPYYWAGR